MKYTNRELWLEDFSKECVKLFKDSKDLFKFPKGIKLDLRDIKITCGFPPHFRKSSQVGRAGNYSAMGVCFGKTKDRPFKQIFILPDWCNNKDIVNLGGVLIHELIHAVDNCVNGHGKEFRDMAVAVGLEGQMRSTRPGADLSVWIRKIAKKLGKYPEQGWIHSKHKPGSRSLKIECWRGAGVMGCEAIARMSQSQINQGTPICRCTKEHDIEERGMEDCRMVSW